MIQLEKEIARLNQLKRKKEKVIKQLSMKSIHRLQQKNTKQKQDLETRIKTLEKAIQTTDSQSVLTELQKNMSIY